MSVWVHYTVCVQIVFLITYWSRLPVVGDSEELFKAELGHVTFSADQRVNVDEYVAAVDDAVHLMNRIQHHLPTVAHLRHGHLRNGFFTQQPL